MTQGVETRLDGSTLVVRIPMRFQRRGGRKCIVAPDGNAIVASSKLQPDGALVKALARAWRWQGCSTPAFIPQFEPSRARLRRGFEGPAPERWSGAATRATLMREDRWQAGFERPNCLQDRAPCEGGIGLETASGEQADASDRDIREVWGPDNPRRHEADHA